MTADVIAKLDNAVVELNDTVWDVLLGTGKVVSLNADGSFEVLFGKRQMVYQSGGYFSEVKRLYWSDPVFLVPQKESNTKLSLLRDLINFLDERL